MVIDDRNREERTRQIDRLVDGELSNAERRELLLALERDPDGWRACALAFLEAQSWRGEISAAVHGSAAVHDSAVVNSSAAMNNSAEVPAPRRIRTGWRGFLPTHPGAWLSIAAGLLLAFGLGREMRGPAPGDATRPGQTDITNNVADSTANLPVNRTPARETNERSNSPWGDARLVFDERGNLVEEFEVPLVDSSALDNNWLAGNESPFTAEELQELKRQGYSVRQRRKLSPYRTGDGRQVVVPEHEVEIVPASDFAN